MAYGVNIWKINGVSQGFVDTARDVLENEFESQLNFNVTTFDMGDAPGHIQDCSKSEDEVLDAFETWRQNNGYLDGEHHMLIVDCVKRGWGGWARGGLSTKCDTSKWGRSVVNAALNLYANNYFKNAVMHEFAHTAMTASSCPGSSEHTCGSTYHDAHGNATVTPMMTSYAKECEYSADCGNDLCSADKYVMSLSTCTKNGLESYYSSNSGDCDYKNHD